MCTETLPLYNCVVGGRGEGACAMQYGLKLSGNAWAFNKPALVRYTI